jgi:protoporphyrinogen oxidase
MPLNCLLKAISDRPALTGLARDFKYSSSHVVGIGIKGMIPDFLEKKCWIYFPEPEVPFYRATALSNYSPFNVPNPGKEWSLMCEVSESSQKPVDASLIVQDVEEGMKAAGLLAPRPDILTRWHKRLEYGYPTPFLKRDELLEKIDPELRALGIFSRGRFGAWKYEVSNQDHSLMQGVEAVNHLLLGQEERTYHKPHEVNQSRK